MLWGVPALPVAMLILTWGHEPRGVLLAVVAFSLVLAIVKGVHHAEVIAHRVGDPFGAIILALSVTVLEAGLLIMLMTSETGPSSLARDTLFAVVMLVTNGMMGACMVVVALRHHVGTFRVSGTGGMLATLITLTFLTLVLPSFTTSEPGPEYSASQLAFAAVASLVLYAVFAFTQTVRHREAFLPEGSDEAHVPATVAQTPPPEPAVVDDQKGFFDENDPGDEYPDDHRTSSLTHLALLVTCLAAVVGLAKVSSSAIEDAVSGLATGKALVGVIVAFVVLMPETASAVLSAWRNRFQTSLNLALGSGIASIGLTVPVIALAAWLTDTTLLLGLGTRSWCCWR